MRLNLASLLSKIGVATLLLGMQSSAFAWGETGHNVIGRVAARLAADELTAAQASPDQSAAQQSASQQNAAQQTPVATPSAAQLAQAFATALGSRYIQMGHLANIPDIHWRNLDGPDGEDGSLLGDAAHFFDSDMFVDQSKNYQVSLDYEEAKKQFAALQPGGKFYQNGTLPWRAQQLYNLYVWTLKQYGAVSCDDQAKLTNSPTKTALAFAGIMAHFSGDVSQPYHVVVDYDGVAANQKGIHSYFESKIVDGLEFGLEKQVYARAKELFGAPRSQMHSVAYFLGRTEELFGNVKPDAEIVAMMLAIANDSLYHKQAVADLDAKYALATAGEAWDMPQCKDLTLVKSLKAQYDVAPTRRAKREIAATKIYSGNGANNKPEPACRRDIESLVDDDGNVAGAWGRPVKDYFNRLIVERLALSAAVTAYIWNKGWQAGGSPQLCPTYSYALKPSFVSPTDAQCFGYALHEAPGDFLKGDGTSALPWKHAAPSTDQCLSF